MSSSTLRVIRSEPGDAAHNMAVDEALLRTASQPTLRIYEWSPAAISLGHFQDIALFANLDAELPLVRRLTGGGAILHDQELTLSLAVDAELLPREVAASYDLVHGAVQAALLAVGMRGVSVAACDKTAGCSARSERWCFAQPSQPDLITDNGGKIFGSAQRRLQRPRRRVLHHGSLVLAPHPLTPFCGSVSEQLDVRQVRAGLAESLVSEVARALRLQPEPGALDAAEQQEASRLRDRYANASATAKVRSSGRRASRQAR